jgi:dihydrofolate reductase
MTKIKQNKIIGFLINTQIMSYKFDMVLATDAEGGIGNKGQLPWPHDPDDMKRFAQITMGGVVIMGRKTYESLPANKRPLARRINIVLSSSSFIETKDVNVCKSFQEALDLAWSKHKDRRVFVIGGARVFQAAFDHPALNIVHWTLFHKKFECDTYFTTVFCRFYRIISTQITGNADCITAQALTAKHTPSASEAPIPQPTPPLCPAASCVRSRDLPAEPQLCQYIRSSD